MATQRKVPPASSDSPLYSAIPQSPHMHDASSRPPGSSHPSAASTLAISPEQSSYDYNLEPSMSRTRPSNSYVSGSSNAAYSIAKGRVGSGYGPYSYDASSVPNVQPSRFSAAPSDATNLTLSRGTSRMLSTTIPSGAYTLEDGELDDPLHDPDPVRDAKANRSCTPFSSRGWLNVSGVVITILAILALFVGYPIIAHYAYPPPNVSDFSTSSWTNGSGDISRLSSLAVLIDSDTPHEAKTHTATDGTVYNLVFSDEFSVDGRSFYPGDDPFWEAVDLNYWPTLDMEWYSPSAITTENGKLVITMDEVENHNLNFRSGMLQSWNKFCFTTGYIEVSVSLPGSPEAPGLWPAVWTMGNLGRAGYGATTDGTWPYSYSDCDVGTFPNQTTPAGAPAAATTGGANGGPLSYQPGQRVSACTCAGGDHPGPHVSVGRGVPEIDVFEAQVDTDAGFRGQVSQSMQIAPFDYEYEFANDSAATPIADPTMTSLNTYKGALYQEAVSAITYINNSAYNDTGYGTYAFEWFSDPDDRSAGYVTWFSEGKQAWKLTPETIGPDPLVEISQRNIPEEPMYIVMNLGMSPGFQAPDFMHMQFPVKMYVDYIRVYQRQDAGNDTLTCDPPRYPTADYIKNHLNAYSNPNLTTWEQAGYTFPLNSQYHGCS